MHSDTVQENKHKAFLKPEVFSDTPQKVFTKYKDIPIVKAAHIMENMMTYMLVIKIIG